MAHIHTEPGQYDHTASAFIINPKNNTLLLHQHKILGIWIQPGGHIELNETPWETLTHELQEETGFDISLLEVLQKGFVVEGLVENVLPLPLVYRTHEFPNAVPHSHIDSAYGFIAEVEPTLPLGEDESDILEWFTYEQLAELEEGVNVAPDTKTIGMALLKSYHTLERVPAERYI